MTMAGCSVSVRNGVMASVSTRRYKSRYAIGGLGSVTTNGLPACFKPCDPGEARTASNWRCEMAALAPWTKL